MHLENEDIDLLVTKRPAQGISPITSSNVSPRTGIFKMRASISIHRNHQTVQHRQNFHALVQKFRQIFAYQASPSMHLPTSHYILLASMSFLAVTQASPTPMPQAPSRAPPPPPSTTITEPTTTTATTTTTTNHDRQPICIDEARYLTYTPYECKLSCEDIPYLNTKGECKQLEVQATEVDSAEWE